MRNPIICCPWWNLKSLLYPFSNSWKETSDILDVLKDNNLDCANQLATNPDQELDLLNNDEPIPLLNKLGSLSFVENDENLKNDRGQHDEFIILEKEDNVNLCESSSQLAKSNKDLKPKVDLVVLRINSLWKLPEKLGVSHLPMFLNTFLIFLYG